ncbi:MAG: DUF11 domain-containing protein [Candidatus Lokiarchaeota archaeon]|nr:DUF11 domain-containing protein [Candidatus Lokiarchaeota archaeon]
MKYKHATVILLISFLAFAPAVVAAGHGDSFAIAQDLNPEEILPELLENGAEVVLTHVDSGGVGSVVYGQLGIPSASLNTEDAMYDDMMALVMLSTQGEMLDYVFELLGSTGGMGDPTAYATGYSALQFDGGFGTEDIVDILGREFSLMVGVYLNLDLATSQQRMGAVLSHYSTTFQFAFQEVYSLRIDESLFPPDANVTLPFDSIDVFIYKETSGFSHYTQAMFSVMNDAGFLGDIDQTKFSEAEASASGMVLIPDIEAVYNAFSGILGGESIPVFSDESPFTMAQLPEGLTGSVAITAAGYTGEQVVSSTSTSLSIGDLLGMDSFTPISDGWSIVLGILPSSVNVTSYTPYDEQLTMYDNTTGMVFWNASALGVQSDYILNFDEDEFPPDISLVRTFEPAIIGTGGSTQVTLTITNNGDTAISNVMVNDTGFAGLYTTPVIDGSTSDTWSTIAAGDSVTLTYTVTCPNEGSYTFPKAALSYEYETNTFVKEDGRKTLLVQADAGSIILQGIMDGMPYTAGIIGLVALVGVIQIARLAKGSGGGGGLYEV